MSVTYMKTHGYDKISVYDVALIFTRAYNKVATLDKGVSGFASTGILPINADKFTEMFVLTLDNEDTEPDNSERLDRTTTCSSTNKQPQPSSSRAVTASSDFTAQESTTGIGDQSNRPNQPTGDSIYDIPKPSTSRIHDEEINLAKYLQYHVHDKNQ